MLIFGAASVSAAPKQVIAYFGTEAGSGDLGGQFNSPGDIAVNSSGAGPADKGDIYVVDRSNNRIQRFAQDANGTPANSYDDTYPFISAWGAGVDSTIGGNNYEICTLAANCQAGIASGGNGTVAGDGAINFSGNTTGITVDQDSGNIYLSDRENQRVNVYTGDGTFLRSFGWDVVAPGSPGNLPNNEQQTVTLGANTTGGSYSLTLNETGVATGRSTSGSKVITDFTVTDGSFHVGDSLAGLGVNAATITAIDPAAHTITASKAPTFTGFNGHITASETATAIPSNASAAAVEASLESLPAVSSGDLPVTGAAGGPYTVTFQGPLADQDVAPMSADASGLSISSGEKTVAIATPVTGASYEVCVAANGDVCKAGSGGSEVGQTGGANGIAITPPDGNTATGTVFLADNRRVNTYSLDGSSPSSFGSEANFPSSSPTHIAVDSRGIVYAGETFKGAKIDRYDSQNANGGGVGFLAPISSPPLFGVDLAGIEVDPDSDGAGPDEDTLYALRQGGNPTVVANSVVQQFGPLNAPGLTAPPVAADEMHGALAEFNIIQGLGFDESNGRLFVDTTTQIGGPWVVGSEGPNGVYVLDKAGAPATASLESLSSITATSAVLDGKVNPNGPPDVSYRVEYSLDGTNWTVDPSSGAVLGSQESPQSVAATLDPPNGGLRPNTLYHVRLVATRPFNPPVISNELTFNTAMGPALVETTGSPVRTTATARLEGRLDPSGSPTSFHFEYGTDGSCDANPCTSTEPLPAGSGSTYELASQSISGLQANTTYHYRIVADNGNPGSPSFGEDMTLTTRSSGAPLSHGHLPGPPASDRAYEQVTLPETGGNPVNAGVAFSDNGDRAVYILSGGNPSSPVGGFRSQFFAERVETAAHTGAWESVAVMPPRDELSGSNFNEPSGPSDLSSFAVANFAVSATQRNVWRLSPTAPAQ
ncbi:MAG TPA: hypothetical protein VMR96_01495, partial [Solirubrobacterales bacterium]|nr:hypothetical protein [Solirubrobacterales bacterium]